MARSVWLEIALEQYSNLPTDVQALIDARIDALLDNPTPSDAGYDADTDQWTTTFGSGVGLILYAVVPTQDSVIILRLVGTP